MQEGKKKQIMIGAIVVCLGLAAVIVYMSRSRTSGLDSVARGQMIWVKCRNPDCAVEYQMDNKDYWQYIEEYRNPMSLSVPALICRDCEKKSVFRAVKCEKCGIIFFHGAVQVNFADTCPKCGFSKMKEQRAAGSQ